MNLPNKLTIFRVILVPIMVIIPFLGIKGNTFGIPTEWIIVDLIFIIASITDKLDGYLARKNNQVTVFGKFLDPLADKILVLAALIMLVEATKLPAWIPIIVLAREFMVSGYRLIAVQKGGEVIIKVDGKDYGTYPLNEDKTIDIDEHNKVIIKEGVVYMEDANCPDKLCIKQGKIDSNGQKIVCLPNKTVVEIRSEKESEDDVQAK